MSNEEKQELQMNDEKRAFIREQIAPKRRSAFRRFIISVFKTSFLAVLFGLIGSFVFCALYPHFEQIFGPEEQDAVVLEEPTPTPPVETVKESEKDEEKDKDDSETEEDSETQEVSAVIDIDSYRQSYQLMCDLAKEFDYSVVTVSGVQSGVDWFDNPAQLSDATSGIVIADSNRKYYILTSYDKISEVSQIQVTFSNDETVEAVLEGKDKDTNIAVISIETDNITKDTKKKITVATLGDSYYAQKGVPVLALGNPNGYVYSMGIGMITGDTMEQYVTDAMVDLYSTDMESCEEGEGVIVDLDGKILGIITHKFDDSLKNSMCTMIGINRVKTMIEKMINGTSRSYIGVVARNIPEEYMDGLGAKHGIYVTEVLNNSPALEAGLQTGDIITDIGDTEISSISNFMGTLSTLTPKQEINIKVIRTTQSENKEKTLSITVGKR